MTLLKCHWMLSLPASFTGPAFAFCISRKGFLFSRRKRALRAAARPADNLISNGDGLLESRMVGFNWGAFGRFVAARNFLIDWKPFRVYSATFQWASEVNGLRFRCSWISMFLDFHVFGFLCFQTSMFLNFYVFRFYIFRFLCFQICMFLDQIFL